MCMSIVDRSVIFLIRLYQIFLSPFFPGGCRFYPTCSEYTKLAIGRYGILKGIYIGLRRLSRCHPFSPGGYDPLK